LESLEDVFDDIPDALFASIPEISISTATTKQSHVSAVATDHYVSVASTELPAFDTTQSGVPDVSAVATEVHVSAAANDLPDVAPGPKMLNGPSVTIASKLKNTVQKVKKRTSDRLRKLKTKSIKGPGATIDAPMVLDESEEGVLTQEGIAEKEGVVLPYMRTMPTLVAEK